VREKGGAEREKSDEKALLMVCSGLTKEDKKFWDEIIAYFPLI
jgi:hypothetical protein